MLGGVPGLEPAAPLGRLPDLSRWLAWRPVPPLHLALELEHGQFGPWHKAEFRWGERTAQYFIVSR
jgi:hypothetical protein